MQSFEAVSILHCFSICFVCCLCSSAMDAPAKYNHISDAVFKNAWNESIHKQYNIASRQFYEVKKARMIVANIKRGRPQKHEQCYRGKRLLAMRRPSKNKTKEQIARTRLTLIYPNAANNKFDIFLCNFLLTMAFAREFLRVGIDPLIHHISWSSVGFSVDTFLSILKTKNPAVSGQPSMHDAMWGQSGQV